jgi:hypothetical protein
VVLVQIRPFDAGDVAVAGRLLADRHRREQVTEPLLPRRFADPDLCAEVVRRVVPDP